MKNVFILTKLKNFYMSCRRNQTWKPYDPGLGTGKQCIKIRPVPMPGLPSRPGPDTDPGFYRRPERSGVDTDPGFYRPQQKDKLCDLNHTHFRKVSDGHRWRNGDKYKKCLSDKQSFERHSESEAKDICSSPGYVSLLYDRKISSLGDFLSILLNQSFFDHRRGRVHDSLREYRKSQAFDRKANKPLSEYCGTMEEARKRDIHVEYRGILPDELEFSDEQREKCRNMTEYETFAMEIKWARQYCQAAENIHKGCAEAAKRCSDTPTPTMPVSSSPTATETPTTR